MKRHPHLSIVKSRPLPKVALIIPAYNEEGTIEQVLLEVENLKKERPRWDILPIVVNDGSTDGTEAVLERLGAVMKFQVIPLPFNLGIGRAIQTGFYVADRWNADVVLQLDGDGQHPASHIPSLVCPILAGKADVVVGSRYVSGGGGNVSSISRQWGTRFFSLLLKVLAGIQIKDTTSGFRAFSRESADFMTRCMVDDYPEVDAYVPLARGRFTVVEVPVEMRPRGGGTSSIHGVGSLYYIVKVLLTTALNMLRPLPVRRSRVVKFEGQSKERE